MQGHHRHNGHTLPLEQPLYAQLLLISKSSIKLRCSAHQLFGSMFPHSTARAVAVASFVVFLGSVPSLHHALTMTHPYKADATLIDYTFCSLAFPPMLLGIKAGVLLNIISPSWFISFLLIVLYSASTFKQVLGTIKIQRQEATMEQLIHKLEEDVADLDAAASGMTPYEEPSDAVKHALAELQHDIQEIAYLSHEVMRQEARSLPPELLQWTTSTAIRSTLDALWLLPSNDTTPAAAAPAAAAAHGMPLRRHGSLQHLCPSLATTSSGTLISKLPHSSSMAVARFSQGSSRPAYSRSTSSSNRFLQAFHPSFRRQISSGPLPSMQPAPSFGVTAAGGFGPAPAVVAAPVAVLPEQGVVAGALDSSIEARALRHSSARSLPSVSGLAASYRRSLSLTDHKPHKTAAAAAAARFRAASFSHSHSMLRPHREAAVVGVTTSTQQLVELAHVLCHAPDLARMLNHHHGSTGSQPHDLLQLVGSPAGGSPAGGSPRQRAAAAVVAIPEDASAHPQFCGDLGSAHTQLNFDDGADHCVSSYGLIADSPFMSHPELCPVGELHTKQQAPPAHDTLLAAVPGEADAADAAADIEKGFAGAAATGLCSSKLQQFAHQLLQLLTWQGLQRTSSSLAAGLRLWWQQQPKQQLLLVLVSFIVYAVVNGLLVSMPKCGAGQYIVLIVYLLITVAMTGAATRVQWTAAASADIAQQLEPELSPKEAAASSTATTPGAVKDIDVTLVLDHLQSCPKQQQHLQGSTACAASVLKTPADASDCMAHRKDDNESIPSSSSSGLLDSEDINHLSNSSNAAAAEAGSVHLLQQTAAPAAPAFAADTNMELNQPYDEIIWTRPLLLSMPGGMFIVGMFSGLLGCSPNTLFLTPLLLQLNCHPQVAAATLKLALFVSSACSSLAYLLNRQLLLSFGLAFGIANLLTTPLGQWLMDAWIAKTGKPSLIMVAAVARNLASIPLLVAFNGVPGVLDLLHHTNVAFMLYKLACA